MNTHRVALVSGPGRGIGREIALKLASAGASVVVNDLDGDVAAATAADITVAGGTAVSCVGSVTDNDFADRFVGTAAERFGGAAHYRQQRRVHLGQRRAEDDRPAVGRHPGRAPQTPLPDPAHRPAGHQHGSEGRARRRGAPRDPQSRQHLVDRRVPHAPARPGRTARSERIPPKHRCPGELASHKRPLYVAIVDQIPVTQFGKTDKKAVGALFENASAAEMRGTK